MKKIILLLISIAPFLNLHSQNNTEKHASNSLQFHSIQIAPLSLYYNGRDGGGHFNVSLATRLHKNIFKITGGVGGELDLSGDNDSFVEANLLYGREFYINEHFDIDGFAGVGYISYNFPGSNPPSDGSDGSSVALPLEASFRWKASKRFHVGIMARSTINSAATYTSGGAFLQFRF